MKLPIKTKKDWIILLIILFIVLYYITMYYNFHIASVMIKFAPYKMNNMNYPEGWGNLVLVGFIMTILIIIIMILQRVSKKCILLSAAIGIAFSILMFTGFLIHTNLVVGTSKTLPFSNVWIGGYEKNSKSIVLSQSSPSGKKLAALAVSLKPKPKSEQRKLKIASENKNTCNIWISYPKKYGQSYDLILYVSDHQIYSYHGMGTWDCRVFYEDNGFLRQLQDIREGNNRSTGNEN